MQVYKVFCEVGVLDVDKWHQQRLNTCTKRKQGYHDMAATHHEIYPSTNHVPCSSKHCFITPSTPNNSCHRPGHSNGV